MSDPTAVLLAEAALKATLLLAAAALAALALRRAAAATRHDLWTLALAAAAALPLLLPLLPALPVALPGAVARAAGVAAGVEASALRGEAAPTSQEGGRVAGPADASTEPATERPDRTAASSPPSPVVTEAGTGGTPEPGTVLLALWAAGALGVAAWQLAGRAGLARLARSAAPVTDGTWRRALDDARAALGLRRPVRLLASPAARVPMTWGLLRPVLLLPAGAEGWDAERRRVVLLHELAHVRRRDAAAQALAGLACAAHWFHPGVWWAAARARAERERACDDAVLAARVDPYAYAGHLLEIARGAGRAPAAGMAMARPAQLEGRLLAVLDGSLRRGAPARPLRAAAGAGALALLLPLAALAPAAPTGGAGLAGDWIARVPAEEGLPAGWAGRCADPLCRAMVGKARALLGRAERDGVVAVQEVGTGTLVAYTAAGEEPVPRVASASVAKLALAAAWWEAGLGDRVLPCPARLEVAPGEWIDNAGVEAEALRAPAEVIVRSCNTAAARLALEARARLGADSVARLLRRAGWAPDGAPFWTEAQPEWTVPPPVRLPLEAAEDDAAWTRLAVGVGPVEVTPLHVSRFLQAIGNDGVALAPSPAGAAPDPAGRRALSPATARRLRAAMRETVRDGTARRVVPQLEWTSWSMGGKTGTSGGGDGWFAGLAFDAEGRPRYTVVVWVEGGGSGGRVPAGIAAEMTRLLARVEGGEL